MERSKIFEVIDDANYKVKLVKGKNTFTVNKSRLKRCYARKVLEEMQNDTLESSYEEEDKVGEEGSIAAPAAKSTKGKKGKKKNMKKKGSGRPKKVIEQEIVPVPQAAAKDIPNTDSTNHNEANTRPKRHRVAPDRYGQSK